MRPALLTIAAISILTLTSCSTPQDKKSSAEKPFSTTEDTKKSGFSGMKNVVTKTKIAIEAENFDQAKTDFTRFEDSWKTVEDGVKATAPARYTAIEDAMEAVNKGVKEKNKSNAIAALESLTKNVEYLDK